MSIFRKYPNTVSSSSDTLAPTQATAVTQPRSAPQPRPPIRRSRLSGSANILASLPTYEQVVSLNSGENTTVTSRKLHGSLDAPDTGDSLPVEETRTGRQPASHRVLDGTSQELRTIDLFRKAYRMRLKGYDHDHVVRMALTVVAKYTPVLPEGEVLRCINNAFGYTPPTSFTDLGNAERFVTYNRGNVRYHQESRTWMAWDGFRWETDAVTAIHRLVKETIRSIADEANGVADENQQKAILSHAKNSESKTRIDAMLSLAARELGIVVKGDALDADDLLLGVQNGVIDLRTCDFRPARPEDLITKASLATYDPAATCPHWLAFLATIFAGDADMLAYLQRVVGYLLTGLTTERVFFLFYGDGANGKSTLIEVIRALLGDYALQALPETFMTSKWQRGVNNDIARMAGARFVSAAESEEGHRLAEGLVKSLTGGDTVTARFLFREYTEFRSRFKLVLTTNHRPEIRGTAPAIWDRLHLVPFPVSIPAEDRDQHLRQNLLDELSGILNWAIAGCLQWQKVGLRPPEAVSNATREYRDVEDLLDLWLDERTVPAPERRTQANQLYADFRTWLERQGEELITQRQFGERMVAKGIVRVKSNTYHYLGIELRSAA